MYPAKLGSRLLCLAIASSVISLAQAASVTLASYEASETNLTVSAANSDLGLTVAIVESGLNGAPTATDGDRLLKLTITNEADHKVEFRHDWSSAYYDLAGIDQITADVYIADSSALPDLIGMYEPAWDPPSPWQAAANIPVSTNIWTTITIDVSDRSQTDLDQIAAFVFQDLAGTSGVIYVDNLRLEVLPLPDTTWNLNANGYPHGNLLAWKPVERPNLDGYRIYRSTNPNGPFTLIGSSPSDTAEYLDPQSANTATRYYYQVSFVDQGIESDPSGVVSALWNGYTDEELLELMQWATFRYFWYGAHPVCGMVRDGLNTGHSLDIVTTGGSGFGLMAIIVGAERGWITHAQAVERTLTILTFLEDTADRFHGAWPHWIDGVTGAAQTFGPDDDGADLVETAFMIEGMLTARQYFDDPNDPDEIEIRQRATRMWEDVEWTWFRQYPNSEVLYWHWSPNVGFKKNHKIEGFNEAHIVYLLAIASPTYPMPASSYHNGWAATDSYINGDSYYGIPLYVGWGYGGPLFWTHYSYLGFDPRYKRDAYTNYFINNRNISRVHHAHCVNNPFGHKGYGPFCWGMTASDDPFGYKVHEPTEARDNGTIAPTAALSAMPYTPKESMAALRHFYDVYGDHLLGSYGFKDAFNPSENWTAGGFLAIDQGPVVGMIENYRTGLLWKLFMRNPEIRSMMNAIGMYYEIDFNTDGNVNAAEMNVVLVCMHGPDITETGSCTGNFHAGSDLDDDDDIDLADFAIAQTLTYDP